ncbi:MAG: dihydropteroate synthase [bacterium]|nr:dihydropteroate synthase [bacterium]
MRIGSREFELKNHTYIMGILNVTPDSFSDGGRYTEPEAALRRAEQMIQEGADILDVGGESTRPGHTQISAEEEINRVSPVIERVKANFDIPVSIDTYKSEVAQAAIHAGADLVNDIWGLRYDAKMARCIAQNQVACCISHNREEASYHAFPADVIKDLAESVIIATDAGIARNKIILDPGIGFAKSAEQNLQLLAHMDWLHVLELPLLLGTSRKSVIASVSVPPLPIDQRKEGTYVTTVFAVQNDYHFVRVHDIAENKRVIDMTRAIMDRREQPHGLYQNM